jgi:hypothetical protein
MPAETSRLLFSFAATPQYERFLKRLHKKLAAAGYTVADNPLKIADLAIVELALKHGLIAPRRTVKTGGKRAGSGRKSEGAVE